MSCHVCMYVLQLAVLALEAVAAGATSMMAAGLSAAAPAAGASTTALVLPGEREFFDADTAQAALAPLTPGMPTFASITSVKLSTKSFCREVGGSV